MKQFSNRLVLIIALLCFAAPALKAQEDEHGRWINGVSEAWWFAPKFAESEVANAKARWAKINEENETTAHEWAGSFANASSGDVSGSQLRWSTQNGFVLFHINQCSATVINFSYGKVEVTPAGIALISEYNSRTTNQRQANHAKPTKVKLLFVKWRNVPYLIYESEISNFARYAAGFPQEFPYYFAKAQATQSGSVEELPIFPKGYEKLVKKPVKAQIISVGKRTIIADNRIEPLSYVSQTNVTLNIGSASGVKTGMTFYILGSAYEDSVTVQSVGAKTSKGRVIRSFVGDRFNRLPRMDDAEYLPLAAGTAVTTNYFEHLELIPKK